MTTGQVYGGQPSRWREFGMSIVSVAGVALYAVLGFVTGDNHIDFAEGVALGVAVLNALLVYTVPVFPTYRWLKDVINGGLTVLALGVQVLAHPNGAQDWLLILVTFLTGAGVLLAPAVSVKTGGTAINGPKSL
jgi:hypothetical protein